MDSDRQLLFGVLALRLGLLDHPRFIDACLDWAARRNVSLADLLVERGWLTPAGRADVERLLEREGGSGELATRAGAEPPSQAAGESRAAQTIPTCATPPFRGP